MMVKLSEVCTIVSGTTPKSNCLRYWNGDINWITPAELENNSNIVYESQRKITKEAVIDNNLKSFPAGTVLLTSRAPIGKVAISGIEMYCNQGFKNLVCSDRIYNRYLFHFLKSKTQYLNSLGRGATFKEISKSIVENIEIPLPHLEEQCKIAETLDKVSDLIAKRKQQLEKLDLLVKSKFVDMFGDPISNPYCLLTKPMNEVCEIIDGDRGENYPKQNEFSNNGYCLFLNAKNVTSRGFLFQSCTFISKEKDSILRKGKLRRGDVVLTTRGTLGNLAYYDDSIKYDNIRINSGMVILRMKENLVSEKFFIEQFKMKLAFIKEKMASGSAQPQLPISTMNKILVIIPPIERQNQFADFVKRIEEEKIIVNQSVEKIETLKKALMQEYFG